MNLFHRHYWKIVSSERVTHRLPHFDVVGNVVVDETRLTVVVQRCLTCGELRTKDLEGHFKLEADD